VRSAGFGSALAGATVSVGDAQPLAIAMLRPDARTVEGDIEAEGSGDTGIGDTGCEFKFNA
jgi:hypothetical protein